MIVTYNTIPKARYRHTGALAQYNYRVSIDYFFPWTVLRSINEHIENPTSVRCRCQRNNSGNYFRPQIIAV